MTVERAKFVFRKVFFGNRCWLLQVYVAQGSHKYPKVVERDVVFIVSRKNAPDLIYIFAVTCETHFGKEVADYVFG